MCARLGSHKDAVAILMKQLVLKLVQNNRECAEHMYTKRNAKNLIFLWVYQTPTWKIAAKRKQPQQTCNVTVV